MFNNEKMQKLENRINESVNLLTSENKELRFELNRNIIELKNELEGKLVHFHKEITDKYFSTLEKILRVHTESSIVTALAHNIDQKTLDNLKSSLMQPFLEAKWKADKEQKGETLLNNGEQVILEMDRLHKEMLETEKKGEDVSKLKIKVDTYKEIIGSLAK